jgi:hypothetical protein
MLPNCEPFRVELSPKVEAVIAALRALERPMEVSIDALRSAVVTLTEAGKEYGGRYWIPFEVNIHIELANRAWSAIYAAWKAGDEEKAIVLIWAVHESHVACSQLNELHRAIAHDWDPNGNPPRIAVEALRAWDDSGNIIAHSYRMTPEAVTIWFRKCPDPTILVTLARYLLIWCKCRAQKHRMWIWAFHEEFVFSELLAHAPFVDAFVDALPRMYPHLSELGIANRAKIIRSVAFDPKVKMTKEQRTAAFAMFRRIELRGVLRESYKTFNGAHTTATDRKTLGWKPK